MSTDFAIYPEIRRFIRTDRMSAKFFTNTLTFLLVCVTLSMTDMAWRGDIMKNRKEENPTFTKKGAWLWLLCAPVALIVSAHYDSKKSIEKKKAKRHRKAMEHWDEWWS